MPRKGSKKRRRFGERDGDPFASAMGPRNAVDLFVPLCKAASCPVTSPEQTLASVLQQLRQAGYCKCALTHTVYGRPKEEVDEAEVAIPTALLQQSPIPVLRRLHVVVETLTDVALFAGHQSSPIEHILNGYDIVSLNPRNAATWEAACRTVVQRRLVDILSVDYHSSYGLPFRIKRADLQHLAKNNIALEIPYGPALIDPKARRNLMLTCNEAVVMAGAGRVLLSSGPRLVNNVDMGPQALRSPGDLLNFAGVVMGLSAQTVRQALDGSFLLNKKQQQQQQQQQKKRPEDAASSTTTRPQVRVTNIEIMSSDVNDDDDDDKCSRAGKKPMEMGSGQSQTLRRDNDNVSPQKRKNSSDNVHDDDGFIAM
jgi:RNase P subunit p30